MNVRESEELDGIRQEILIHLMTRHVVEIVVKPIGKSIA